MGVAFALLLIPACEYGDINITEVHYICPVEGPFLPNDSIPEDCQWPELPDSLTVDSIYE